MSTTFPLTPQFTVIAHGTFNGVDGDFPRCAHTAADAVLLVAEAIDARGITGVTVEDNGHPLGTVDVDDPEAVADLLDAFAPVHTPEEVAA